MTLMTLMTISCRGSLNGVAAPSWELEGAVMGRSHGPQGGSREPFLDQLHEGRAHPGQPSPQLVDRVAWRRTRPEGLCYASTFYTILVKKSQQVNGASASWSQRPGLTRMPCTR